MKPAILYLLTSLDTTGGTASKIKGTLNYTKYKVYVAANYNPQNEEYIKVWNQERDVQIINLPPKGSIFKTVLQLNKIVKNKGVKIVHSFFPYEMFIAFLLKLLNPDLIIIRSFEGNVKRRIIIRLLSKLIIPRVDKIIFISKYVENYYKNHTKKCKNTCIIDNAGFHISEYKVRKSKNEFKILSVAGLNIHKNVFMYAKIGKVLKERNFPFIIKIAGDGPLKEELQKLIDSNDLHKYVHLLGKINDPKPFYDESDIYIHPADQEGFGIVVAEAMSSGLPVIVSDRGGVPELVNNMDDGMIVDAYNPEEWADAIVKLYNDRDLYNKISRNGYKTYCSRFTPEIFAKKLDSVYDSLLNY